MISLQEMVEEIINNDLIIDLLYLTEWSVLPYSFLKGSCGK